MKLFASLISFIVAVVVNCIYFAIISAAILLGFRVYQAVWNLINRSLDRQTPLYISREKGKGRFLVFIIGFTVGAWLGGEPVKVDSISDLFYNLHIMLPAALGGAVTLSLTEMTIYLKECVGKKRIGGLASGVLFIAVLIGFSYLYYNLLH